MIRLKLIKDGYPEIQILIKNESDADSFEQEAIAEGYTVLRIENKR